MVMKQNMTIAGATANLIMPCVGQVSDLTVGGVSDSTRGQMPRHSRSTGGLPRNGLPRRESVRVSGREILAFYARFSAIPMANLEPMAVKVSAGLLMYRVRDGQLEVFLAHPGGPYSFRKDEDTWSIPKGEVEANEGLLEAAIREFTEEVGFSPRGELTPLGSIRQKSGKIVHACAFAGDWTASSRLVSSPFELEWPPGSGRVCEFPEVDRVGFFNFA